MTSLQFGVMGVAESKGTHCHSVAANSESKSRTRTEPRQDRWPVSALQTHVMLPRANLSPLPMECSWREDHHGSSENKGAEP